LDIQTVTEDGGLVFLMGNNDVNGYPSSRSYERDPFPTGTPISGTATSGDSTTLNDTGLSLSTDSEVNRLLRITAGTNAGEERQITANGSGSFTVKYPFSQPIDATSEYEIVTLYLCTIEAKHVGTGERWYIYSDLDRFGSGLSIHTSQTDWKTFTFFAYGGDEMGIREINDNNDGAVYVRNLNIFEAVPVDRTQIASDWEAHNTAAINAIEDVRWSSYPPIGSRATLKIPKPGDTDSGEPTGGVI
jgi:hypothetical protein